MKKAYIWIQLKEIILDDFYHERILKLNVSNVDAHRIEEGIRKIASALKNPQNYFL